MLLSGVGALEADVTKPLSAEKVKNGANVINRIGYRVLKNKFDVISLAEF